MRVLDLGCGPGELRRYLPDVQYVGIDISPTYIARAQELYGDSAEFRVGDAAALDRDLVGFEVVLAFGVLHHLEDAHASELLRGAAGALAPGGRIVTVDPAITQPQPRLARAMVTRDRGQHVREPDEYRNIADTVFGETTLTVRTDLLRIPYTHAILECRQPR